MTTCSPCWKSWGSDPPFHLVFYASGVPIRALPAPDAQGIGTVMTLPAGAKSRLRDPRNDPEGTPHLMDFSHLEGALTAPGDSIKTEAVGPC